MTRLPQESNIELPDGACDCAIHVYEAGFAIAQTATFDPPVASLDAYCAESGPLGFERVVIAQPSAYGFDNTCTLLAIARHGVNARGLAVIPAGTPASDIEAMHNQGMRGIRYMLFPGGALPADALEDVAAAVAPFGWHINLRLPLDQLPSFRARLKRLATTLVIDLDLGCCAARDRIESETLSTLRALVDTGSTWLKLASPYSIWLGQGETMQDGREIQEAFVHAYPDRCVWASNWPHPNVAPTPTLRAQMDWALARMPAALMEQIFVHNPARLYGF